MKNSAGIALFCNKRLLLAHPTGNKWFGTYSIPKGNYESGESILDCAIREFKEETGLPFKNEWIKSGPLFFVYPNGKRIDYFVAEISGLSDIGLNELVVPKNLIQINEVDWVGFLDIHQAQNRISTKQLPVINQNIKFL